MGALSCSERSDPTRRGIQDKRESDWNDGVTIAAEWRGTHIRRLGHDPMVLFQWNQGRQPNSEELITFSSLQIEVLGPQPRQQSPRKCVRSRPSPGCRVRIPKVTPRASNIVSGPQGIRTPIRRKAKTVKDKLVRWRGEGVEYPALGERGHCELVGIEISPCDEASPKEMTCRPTTSENESPRSAP